MCLIRRLCVEEGVRTELADKLTEKLTENLKEALSDNKVRADTVLIIDINCLTLSQLIVPHFTQSLKRSSYRHEQADFC